MRAPLRHSKIIRPKGGGRLERPANLVAMLKTYRLYQPIDVKEIIGRIRAAGGSGTVGKPSGHSIGYGCFRTPARSSGYS